MSKQIILSGIRPTGKMHIGNYLGALRNFIELQKKYECYFFIADLHSLNEKFDPKNKRNQLLELAKEFIAAGIDPRKSTLFVQSYIPEHSEMAVILANTIPVSYLFRMTQYKDKSSDRAEESVNAGLLYYPVLMAADILLYNPTFIPVGQDQTQHVELARDAAKFFNKKFGSVFTEPKTLYSKTPKIMSLLDPNKKMSKSLGDGHCIYLDDEPEIIKKKLSKAVTDTGDGKGAGAKNLLDLMEIFSKPEIFKTFNESTKNGTLRYSDLKEQLSKDISIYFSDFRKRKASLKNSSVEKILQKGNKKAQHIAEKTLQRVRKTIGIR